MPLLEGINNLGRTVGNQLLPGDENIINYSYNPYYVVIVRTLQTKIHIYTDIAKINNYPTSKLSKRFK